MAKLHGWRFAGGFAWLVAFALLTFGLFAPPAHAISSNDPSILQRVQALTEALLRHPLEPSLWDQLLADEAKHPVEYNEETIARLDRLIKILREQNGSPTAFHLRHIIATSLAYHPRPEEMPAAFLYLVAYDPRAVFDNRNKRIMTLADIRAVMSIRQFIASQKDPRDIMLASEEFAEDVAMELQRTIKRGGSLTDLSVDAAAFWAGITQNWGNLSASEQKTVRDYAKRGLTGHAALPDKLALMLLGWSQNELNMKKPGTATNRLNTGALAGSYSNRIINITSEALAIAP